MTVSSRITVVIAGDKNFRPYVEVANKLTNCIGYQTLVYDLGDLGFGKPFAGRFSDEPNAKIPCKPHILLDALNNIMPNDFLVWLDADALIWEPIDEIVGDYDIGVTVRLSKSFKHGLPINAGVVFIKNTEAARNFITEWARQSDQSASDQTVLNSMCSVDQEQVNERVVRWGATVYVWSCRYYNNFYFHRKSSHSDAKIKHYKTKIRNRFPLPGAESADDLAIMSKVNYFGS